MKATLFAVVVPLLLAGCTGSSPLPEVTATRSPVSPTAKVPRTHYHTTLTGYTHRLPVAPKPWATEDDGAVPAATPALVPETTPVPVPDAITPKADCKKTEGASDDCLTP